MSTSEDLTRIAAINVGDIIRSIEEGTYDTHLEAIHDAVRERRRVRVATAAAEITGDIKVGDRVRLNSSCRPRYMIGAEGVVTKINGASFKVKLDDPTSRFGAEPRCPKSLIELVPS